ncbi:TPA: hypothetical protein N0F65_002434 [Lagenidium giganteum]|uniref:Uncharacterized protein n=1 Tax=Lagenidium giganteum TaxID=4803 RepID=A0AAV2YL47_9STRA|nr:TPA: hypothetical protein N0F65_002434 [Lagenidium giganteum]
MRNSAAQAANDTTPIVKVHSVERLQAAVDSLAAAKTKQSQRLAKSIQHLNEDRRDCLTTKFKHFVVHDSVDHDVQQMREASEQQRQQRIEENIMHQSWYQDLLRALLSRETPLHPAELFIVQAVRRILNDGQEFTPALLYHVLLAMDLDDVALPEVQQILVCLRKALHIPIDDWEAFFVKHGLPEPIEVQQRKEHKAEKRQVRLAKLRNVMTMNQVLRQFPPRILPKPGLSHRGSRKSGLQLQLLQRLGPFD